MQWTKVSLFTLALEAASLLAACGGDRGGGGGIGDGGARTRAPVPGGDETAFVPEVEHALDAATGESHGLRLVAATVARTPEGDFWLVAVKNEGAKVVCAVSITATFQDTNMASLGTAQAWVQATMHRVENRFPEPCIATGEVGIGLGLVTSGQAGPVVHRVVYRPIGRAWDGATRLSDVTLDDIVIDDPGAEATLVRGTITNRGTNDLQHLMMMLFPLNKVGRPFSFGPFIFGSGGPSMPLVPGTRLDFYTAVTGPVDRYAVFPQYTY